MNPIPLLSQITRKPPVMQPRVYPFHAIFCAISNGFNFCSPMRSFEDTVRPPLYQSKATIPSQHEWTSLSPLPLVEGMVLGVALERPLLDDEPHLLQV